MTDSLSTSREYGNNATPKAALLVAGFMGKIDGVEGAAHTLVNRGYNVFAYEFSSRVLTEGNPLLLPEVVNEITSDFTERTTSYKIIQPCGVSLGAGIAWETQKREQKRALPGVYAAAGANSADGIFSLNPIMLPLRRAFVKNGHDHEELKELWADIHEPPQDGFTIALGALDYIVRYRNIMKKIQDWKDQGIPISERTLWHLSHTGTIRWYDNNLNTLLNTKR